MKIKPIKANNLSDLAHVNHGFFSRVGGNSDGIYKSLNCKFTIYDRYENVKENRFMAIKTLKLLPSNLCLGNQIHGNSIAVISKAPKQNIEVDGFVTKVPGLALGILTADCAPLLIADKKKKIIGAAHCGWKGSLYGIIEETVAKMIEIGSKPQHLFAAIGPCLGPDSYEVSNDFIVDFKTRDSQSLNFFNNKKDNKSMFDLPGYIKYRLEKIGIKNINHINIDTYKNKNLFFSYRRSSHIGEKDFGCQLSVIAIVN